MYLIEIRGLNTTEYTLNTTDLANGVSPYGLWYWRVYANYPDGNHTSSPIFIFNIEPKRTSPGLISIFDVILAMFLGPIPLALLAIIFKHRKKKQGGKSPT